jgi:hypothetical protein
LTIISSSTIQFWGYPIFGFLGKTLTVHGKRSFGWLRSMLPMKWWPSKWWLRRRHVIFWSAWFWWCWDAFPVGSHISCQCILVQICPNHDGLKLTSPLVIKSWLAGKIPLEMDMSSCENHRTKWGHREGKAYCHRHKLFLGYSGWKKSCTTLDG